MGTPFVFEVRDLWPESILAVEAMGENAIVRGLKSLARFLYLRSSRIVTVGEGYRRSIHDLYDIDSEKMSVVPNGIDPSLFIPGPRENEVRRALGWEGRFVLLYLGTHGMAHALDRVLEAARRMQGESRFLFAFVGEGAEKHNLKRRAADWGLTNVQFIDQQPKERVPLYYSACDLGLVTLRDAPLFQEVLPSKIFEYLGMERPVLLSVGGEARKLVESSGGGEYVPPENVDAMVTAIRRLSTEPERLAEMGRRGRSYVCDRYDRKVLAAQYLDILDRVISSRGAAQAP
jgi:glycosyltransferase involved in cell wall biosynthesis